MTSFIAAAAQYPVERLADFAGYQAKMESWVAEAAAGGAKLVVFPEYGGMELTALHPATVDHLHASIAALQPLVDRVDSLHADLAARHDIHICAATLPVRDHEGRFHNHARLFAPNGKCGTQQKIVMTRFEREEWDIAPGGPLRVFHTDLGTVGIAICYDVEFPLIVRALAEAGATVILAPSATDSLHGYHRVRIGAQARALENQCHVIQAPVIGQAEWTPALGISHGAAGIYGPPDLGFPPDGVIAQGALDVPGWVFGMIDPESVARVRRDGAVLNHANWREQGGRIALPPVERIDLRT